VSFKVNMESFYLACLRFEGVLKKGDLTELLACILQPSNSLNNLCRKKVYRELAKYADYKERQPLSAYLVKAVRMSSPMARESTWASWPSKSAGGSNELTFLSKTKTGVIHTPMSSRTSSAMSRLDSHT
jgi:hypothetical protein